MSSTYNAITNLQEIEMDSLIVNVATIDTALIDNLDCNVGVIDTLTSSTATITSANIPTLTNTTLTNTTSNTTNLNTNNIQANPVSSAVSLYTTHTGTLTLGNLSNTNGLNINNKLLMATGKEIQITPTGYLVVETIRGNAFANTINMYLLQTGAINFGNTASTNPLTINNNTILASGKNLTLSTTGKVVVDTIEGIAAADNIVLFSTTTGTIGVGNLSGGTFSINPNTQLNGNLTLASGKTLTLNTTGGKILCNVYTGTTTSSNLTIGESGNTGTLTIFKTIVSPTMSGTLSVNDIQGTTTSSAITLFTLSSVSSPTITLGNASGGTFTINPNTQLNGNLTLPANKIITLNATGGEILCNVYTGTTTSSNLTLGETGDTGNLQIFKTITSSNTYSGTNTYSGGNTHSGNNTFSGTNTFNNTILGNTITGTSVGSAISLYGTTTSTIGLGNLSGGTFTINPNTQLNGNLTLASGKTLTLNTTGGEILCNVYTGTATSSNLTIGETGDTGNLQIFKNITSSNTYSGTNTFSGGNTHSGSNTFSGALNTFNNDINLAGRTASKILLTNGSKNVVSSSYNDTDFVLKSGSSISGTLNVNDIQGTTTSSAITLFTNSSVSSPTITLGNASGGVFTINPTLAVNTISATSTTSTGSLFGNILGGIINIGGSLTGNMNIGTAVRQAVISIGSSAYDIAIDSGYALCNIPLALQQDVQVASGKNLQCNTYRGVSGGADISLFSTTTATITCGNTGGGNLTINPSVVLASGKNITLSTTGKVVVDTIEGTAAADNIVLFSTTTGTITCGNTGGGNLTINPSVVLASGKNLTLSTTGKVVVDTIEGTAAADNIVLFSTTTGTITCGTTSSGFTFNGDVNVGTSAVNKGIACNYLSTYASSGTLVIAPIFTTGNVQIGGQQSTGTITLGHNTPASDSGTLIINKNTTLAANKNLTLGNQSKLVGGSNGSVNITAVAYTNVTVITQASVAGFYQVFIYGASATQTYSVCCFLSADNSGAIQTTASRNMTFQSSGTNWCITATVIPTSTISMAYNIIKLF